MTQVKSKNGGMRFASRILGAAVLMAGAAASTASIVLLTSAVMCGSVGLWRFNRRDIPVA